MGVYISDVQMAVFFFPIVALLITFPFLLWNYHRQGAISSWSILMSYSLVFYLICAYFLIILPLPSQSAVAQLTTIKYNLHPFTFVREFINYSPFRLSNLHTWIPAIKDATLIQPLFNVFLTVPFGVYLRIYFKRSFKQVVLFSFLLSLFFELTQLSGLYGIYPRPYRLFDVDDLMLNTLGGTIGFLISGTFKNIIPNTATMQHTMQIKSQKVSIFRHSTAAVIDWILIFITDLILGLVLGGIGIDLSRIYSLIWILDTVIVILIPEMLFKKTLGMRLVHVKLTHKNDDQHVSFGNVLVRNILGYSWFYLWALAEFSTNGLGISHKVQSVLIVGLLAYLVLFFSILIVDVLIDLFRSEHDLLFERISKTRLKSTLRN